MTRKSQVRIGSAKPTPGSKWTPVAGSEFEGFLLRSPIARDEAAKRLFSDECGAILRKCVSPKHGKGHSAGLVIGYVQSGKTLSFTGVTALARDNGFQLVIVVAGISDPLLAQSTARIRADLDIDRRNDYAWVMFESKGFPANLSTRIANHLEEWRDKDVPLNQRRTVIVVVMKHHGHLEKLNKHLRKVKMLDRTPTLVIDDEADQASMNTKVRRNEESSTHGALRTLRELLPWHTYLQYTATPQAPLLISMIDELAPQFVELITPGKGYVGGKEFFGSGSKLAVEIPQSELPDPSSPRAGPPSSLVMALQMFVLGVTAGLVDPAGPQSNRSMLLHPSQERDLHTQYSGWVDGVLRRWKRTMESGSVADRRHLRDEFRAAHKQLAGTHPQLPTLSVLFKQFKRAMRVPVTIMNAERGKTPQIDWKGAYAHVLVGGQALDRGFTVEGLTITYMPRGVGVGHVDTVQQRARFFGYKSNYSGLCRVFAGQGVLDTFTKYVKHEEFMRGSLRKLNAEGKALKDWRRIFILDRNLRPTRQSVLALDFSRESFGGKWNYQGQPHVGSSAISENKRLLQNLLASRALGTWRTRKGNTATTTHHYAEGVALGTLLEKLLVPWLTPGRADAMTFTTIQLLLADALEREGGKQELCDVILMSGGSSRQRSLTKANEVDNPFQGASPPNGPRLGKDYSGDRQIGNHDRVRVQIHVLDLYRGQALVASGVPMLAVCLPKRMAVHTIAQD